MVDQLVKLFLDEDDATAASFKLAFGRLMGT
jgi:hypothetical protein